MYLIAGGKESTDTSVVELRSRFVYFKFLTVVCCISVRR